MGVRTYIKNLRMVKRDYILILFFLVFNSIAYGQGRYEVTASVLNVRSQPSTNSSIIGSIKMNDTIDVISIEDNWARFNFKGNVAFASSKYLRKIVEDSMENNIAIDYDINNNNKNKLTFLKHNYNIGLRLVPSVSFGFSNLSVKNVSAKPILNIGTDIALQVILNDKMMFLPKNYIMETSVGYSLKGSRSIPLHYFDLTISPLGYKYSYKDYVFMGVIGSYFGISPSKVRTNMYSFKTNFDIGICWKFGVEYSKYNKLFLSISGEHGLRRVCDSKLKMRNTSIQINISYNLKYINKSN